MAKRFNVSGIITPQNAAVTRLIAIAAAMTTDSRASPNQSCATPATTAAHSTPLSRLIIISRKSSGLALSQLTCPSAKPRTIKVNVWVPAMPPMLATTGISTASATTFSSVASKLPITHEAKNAVIRLIPNHSARRRDAAQIGANISSSSCKPAIDITECSASSRTTSKTSSTVMRPTSTFSSSTTGAET